MTSPFLDQKEPLLESLSGRFMQQYGPIQERMYRRILELAGQLPSAGGAFQPQDDFTLLQQQINAIIRQAVAESGYYQQIGELVTDFGEIDALNGRIHRSLSRIDVDFATLRPARQRVVAEVTQGLLGEGFAVEFERPLRNALAQNIQLGGTLQQAREAIAREMFGTEQVGGFDKKIEFLVNNATRQYDGGVNAAIAAEYELNAYLYVGSLIKESRPQCQRWVQMGTILKSQLESEIKRAANTGSGMFPGTTAANFAQYRGGYNCRHQAIPIRV